MKLAGDFAKLTELRRRLQQAGSLQVREGLARVVGETIRSNLALGFRSSTDPYGSPWAALLRRRGKPLLDTGRLRNSFTYQTSATGVKVGTNVRYAKFHQYGTRRMRRRMMLPTADRGLGNWREPIRQAALRFIARNLRGR